MKPKYGIELLKSKYGIDPFSLMVYENTQLMEENDKLRECLQDFADAIKNNDGFGVDRGWMLDRMRELGVTDD